jgi:hypothetical protein
MTMSKKHFIALADKIRQAKCTDHPFNDCQIALLADFCQSQNANFNRSRWIDYINGECGPNGGKVKK